MRRRVSTVVMDACYRVEILFVQIEIARLHDADRSFQATIAEPNTLFVGILVYLQSPVSKFMASNAVQLNVRYPAPPRVLRGTFARILQYHSAKAISIVSGNAMCSNVISTHIGLHSLTYAQDTKLLRNDLVNPHVKDRT